MLGNEAMVSVPFFFAWLVVWSTKLAKSRIIYVSSFLLFFSLPSSERGRDVDESLWTM